MERQFVLITDTGSDLPEEYYAEHAIDCVKLGFTLDGVEYGEDGGEMDVKKFYELLRGGAMPKTFQVTPAQAVSHIEPFVKEGKDVLVIAFSSGLSGTYGSYLAAAKELKERYPAPQVRVVDSLCASLGQGLFVDYIVKKADSGASLEETFRYAEELKWHICHYFTVDDLFHLKRGGRVSAVAAVAGSLLQVKPVLSFTRDGKLMVIEKCRGMKKAFAYTMDKTEKFHPLEENRIMWIVHTDAEEQANELADMVEARWNFRPPVTIMGPVIGSHVGPGAVAMLWKTAEERND